MARVTSTRRLAIVTSAGGIAFGAFTAAVPLRQYGNAHVSVLVLIGALSGLLFGGAMFLVFYFGFVRPRQLDPDPPEFANRRVSASERFWGDGRPLPVWLRRFMYAAVPLFVVMAILNVGLMVASGTVRPGPIAACLMFVGLAVLAIVVVRRGSRARPPYSTREATKDSE